MGRKLAIMAVGAVLGMGAFGTSSASAANAYTCSFTNGLAGNISPGVMALLGAGHYEFDGQADCTVNGAPVSATIEAEGDFTNAVCGTGLVTGNAVVRDNAGVIADITAEFTIVFNATVGELVVETINGTPTIPTGTDPKGVSGAGLVQILPTTGSCADPSGVTAFSVRGAFAAATA